MFEVSQHFHKAKPNGTSRKYEVGIKLEYFSFHVKNANEIQVCVDVRADFIQLYCHH